ncbi:MAG: DUF2029 domain-containing protein [Planctomycetes bacterium]|nr:DUF2029 domain-containing protein [Planctomycetota bacterium]
MQQTEPGKPGVDLHAILRVGGAVFAVLLALLLAAACLSSYMEWLNAPSDVIAYWQGGTHAMNGEPLYVESHDQAHYRPFLYPPAFAAFFSMFVRLGPRFGLALWAVTHLLFGFLLIRALHAWVAEHVKKPWPWLAVLILLVLFEVFWMELQEGQVNTLVSLLVFTGLLRTLRGKEISGGALLAAAVHLKVFPVMIVGVLLLQKRFRAVGWIIGFCVLLCFLPALASIGHVGLVDSFKYTFDSQLGWIQEVMLPAMGKGSVAGENYLRGPNLSLRAVGYRWFVNDIETGEPLVFHLPFVLIKLGALAISLSLVGMSLWFSRKSARNEVATVVWASVCVFSMQIGSLLYWDHHMILLAAPLAALYMLARSTKGGWRKLVVVLPMLITATLIHLVVFANILWGTPRKWHALNESLLWGLPLFSAIILAVSVGWFHRPKPETA